MAQSIIDAAIATIDAQIADLQRAKDIIAASAKAAPADAPKAKRGRKRKAAGLPASETDL